MKKLINILLGLIFAAGLLVFLYPVLSDVWSRRSQGEEVAVYEKAVEELSPEEYQALWKEAEAYNRNLSGDIPLGDAFSEEGEIKDQAYVDALNVGGTGIMGYVSIPKIQQKIPIYHGTSDDVLQIAAGHLYGSSLPVGGDGSHCVIAAHRGLPSAKLFSEIDQMQKGDRFYLHVLDQVLAYEVDQILPMVEKDDLKTLLAALAREEGADYTTLFTCTPYGINSHRLLVRGHRVEYHGEEAEPVVTVDTMCQPVQENIYLYAYTIMVTLLFVSHLAGVIHRIRRRL